MTLLVFSQVLTLIILVSDKKSETEMHQLHKVRPGVDLLQTDFVSEKNNNANILIL